MSDQTRGRLIRHNHVTRDIKPEGQCEGCDASRFTLVHAVLPPEAPPREFVYTLADLDALATSAPDTRLEARQGYKTTAYRLNETARYHRNSVMLLSLPAKILKETVDTEG